LATAPTKNTIGLSGSIYLTKSLIFMSLPLVDKASLRLSGGKWLVTGDGTIFNKV